MLDLNEICDSCGVVADTNDYSETNGYIWTCECCYSNVCTKCLEEYYKKSITLIVDRQILCKSCKDVIESR